MLLRSLLAGLLSLPLCAAEITWRGGFGDSFSDARNWNLPPDIPAGTPPEQLENFRRVPRLDDVARINAIGDVVVSDERDVAGIEAGPGARLVITNGGHFTVGTTVFGQTNRVADLLVAGGRMVFNVPMEFSARLVARAGKLEFNSKARIETIAEFHGGAEVITPLTANPDREVSFPAGLRLLGEPAGGGAPRLTMKGTYRVGRLLEWGNTHVRLDGDIRPVLLTAEEVAPGAEAGPLPFTLSLRGAAAEGEPLAWTGEGLLDLRPVPGDVREAGIVREDDRVRSLGVELRLDEVGVDNSHGAGTELRFTGDVTVTGANIEFLGPCVFEEFALLTAAELGILNFEPSAQGHGTELRGDAILELDVPAGVEAEVRAAALTLRDRAAFRLKDPFGGGQVALTVSTNRRVAPDTNSTVRVVPLAIRGGRVSDGSLLRVAVGPGAELELGGDAGAGAARAEVSIRAHVDVAGTVTFLPQADGSGLVVTGDGDWRILPGGSAKLEPGCGLDLEFGALVNLGEVRLFAPAAEAEPAPSPLGGMFINDGGRVNVQSRGWLRLHGGDFLGGNVLLQDESRLEILQGRPLLHMYPVPREDAPDEVRSVQADGLVHLRAGVELEVGQDVRVLLTQGSLSPDFPGGLGLEQPLEVDHLVMGGPESALEPRVVFRDRFSGVGLTVKKTLAWHGGQFRGAAGKDHEVLLPAGSATDIRTVGDSAHANVSLLRCVVRNRGSVTVNTDRMIVGSILGARETFINEPGGHVLVTRVAVFSGLLNRGTVTQRLADPEALVLYTSGAQRGVMTIFDGHVTFGSGFRIEQPVGVPNVNVEVVLAGAGLAQSAGASRAQMVEGGRTKRIRGLTIEGEVQLNDVSLEPPVSDPHTLRSEAGLPGTLHLGGKVDWVGGHLDVRADSKVRILPGADVTIATTDANRFFTRWERGTIENEGKVTLVTDSSSKLVLTPNSKFVNKPGGLLVTEGSGEVLAAQLPNSPGELVNEGGKIQFNVPRGGKQTLRAKLTQTDGETRVGAPAGEPGPNAGQARRSGTSRHAAPQREFVAEFDQFLDGGTLEFSDTAFEAAREYVVRFGGRLRFLANTTARFKGVVTMTSGGIELLADSDVTFDARADIRGGLVDLGPDASLTSSVRFELVNGGTLGGLGRFFGSVRNTSGVISPGVNEALPVIGALTVFGDVIFGPDATLELDLPVDAPVPVGDRLVSDGRVTLAGTVTVTTVSSPVRLELGEFYEAVRFASAVGEFTRFVAPLGGGRDLKPEFREAPGRFGFQVVDVPTSVDLALTAEAPLTAPTGSELALRFTVKNRSDQTATGVTLDVPLPANAALAGSDPAGSVAGGRLTVPLPNLPGGAETTATVRLNAPPASAAVTVAATVGSNQADLPPENNATRVTVAVLEDGRFTLGRFALNADGKLRLSFETLPGVRYVLERSTDLREWRPVREFTGDGATQVADNLGGDGREPEFFRLVIPL